MPLIGPFKRPDRFSFSLDWTVAARGDEDEGRRKHDQATHEVLLWRYGVWKTSGSSKVPGKWRNRTTKASFVTPR
jgi:hypothetical protein